jgi:heme/copper-type cytochrome/quinol oxidase subunit 2
MHRRLISLLSPLAAAAVLVLLLASVASACPGCKDAIEKNDPTHGGIVSGYFYSILFMMCTPYLVFATFCGCMYYKVRSSRRRPKLPDDATPAAG